MYFPYLRGKQFELLALRESLDLLVENRHKISPIIEPVKKATASLERCLRDLASRNVNFNIILNPSVGELEKDVHADCIAGCLRAALAGYENYQLAFLIDGESSWSRIEGIMEGIDFDYGGITLLHSYEFRDINTRLSSFPSSIKYNFINYGTTSRRYHRNFPDGTKVSLDDYFKAKDKKSDYSKLEDELYSEEYKFFKEEGFSGFSDYLTVGSGYSDGGFLPYAVAIHLTYLGSEDAIRIRHFVCDSIEDNTDTSGKFREALNKLISWLQTAEHSSTAVDIFRRLHLDAHFPGLGTIKKLSIQNHIELVSKII